ncbi:DUF134 domain-containing protein [Methanocella conradii]|uniref:DUF134 domain-containing protein n=1 Tax=Methanocella conradii TaxID=1175444 RepID=UPI00157C96C2|nr:DUF134 domain-containing protein [Methanocella conradii]
MRERRCAGRPRARRCLSGGNFRCMMPACRREAETEAVTLLPEELEAIKLADLMDMEQEDIAFRMGVSRKTVWKDLHNARKKIADALVNGKALRVEGCEMAGRGACMRWQNGCGQNEGP